MDGQQDLISVLTAGGSVALAPCAIDSEASVRHSSREGFANFEQEGTMHVRFPGKTRTPSGASRLPCSTDRTDRTTYIAQGGR